MHQTGGTVTKQRWEELPHPLLANIFILAVHGQLGSIHKMENMTLWPKSPTEIEAGKFPGSHYD